MKLRYTVEGKFNAAFTASTYVKNEGEALRIQFSLKLLNQKEGYKKYSTFVLYDDENKIVRRW